MLGISQDCQEWQGHLSESKEARAKMPKYGSPSGKATWNEKRSSCGSGCKTLWLIKVYVTRVSRNLAELKSKNAHTVHIENGHKSLPSQRRKKLFLPLAMREPTPNQLAAILAHKQPRWLPKYVKEIEKVLILSTPLYKVGWQRGHIVPFLAHNKNLIIIPWVHISDYKCLLKRKSHESQSYRNYR